MQGARLDAGEKAFRIGELAARAGCSVAAIRYYEDIGLLPRAARRESGHRVYGAAELRRIAFIRRCRDFGFTLEQTKALAALADGASTCSGAHAIAREHLTMLRDRVLALGALERRLSRYADSCGGACGCEMLGELGGKIPGV